MKIAILTLMMISALAASAQEFAVETFRRLPTDVSGFIAPVRDLNGDDCALLKVVCPPDFVFSTPLGIVSRVEKTGEVWLYLPKGSRRLTLKHPQWGVLRDYPFPERLESNAAYELRLKYPDDPARYGAPALPRGGSLEAGARSPRDTVFARDTLLLTRTDTLLLPPPRERIPFSLRLLPTVAFGGASRALSAGLMAVAMRRHGAWLHVQSDFGRIGATSGACARDGRLRLPDGNHAERIPFYSGDTRHSFLTLAAGAAHRLSSSFTLFEGAGYGRSRVAWRLAPSEGSAWVRNEGLSHSGVCIEFGAIYTRRRFTVAVAAVTINATQWYAALGVGIRLGKSDRKPGAEFYPEVK